MGASSEARVRSGIALIAFAIGVALVPLPSGVVERDYSTTLFPLLQRATTALSNVIPIALRDVLLVLGASWIAFETVRMMFLGRRQGFGRAGLAWLRRVSVFAAVVYLAFLVMWGLNYRRVPLTDRVSFDPAAASAEAVFTLANTTADEVNRLYGAGLSHDTPVHPIDGSLAHGFAAAQQAVGVATPARPAQPKWSILDVYFKAAGVEGMTDPFFLETLIAGDLLPFERPFVIAHEWSHLAGFADEGEANFLGWLACTKASAAARYSAALFLYTQLVASLN